MAVKAEIRALAAPDAPVLTAAFAAIGWDKPGSLFDRYLRESDDGLRRTWVGDVGGRAVAYVTLVWMSPDPVLAAADAPEIVDLNVLPDFRRRGIGRALLATAEQEAAARAAVVGLRVGLHPGYGAAQRLYVSVGYVPDGTGALIGTRPAAEGERVDLDDDVTLRLLKRLR